MTEPDKTKRGRGRPRSSADGNLRSSRLSIWCTPDELDNYHRIANAYGLTVSEFVNHIFAVTDELDPLGIINRPNSVKLEKKAPHLDLLSSDLLKIFRHAGIIPKSFTSLEEFEKTRLSKKDQITETSGKRRNFVASINKKQGKNVPEPTRKEKEKEPEIPELKLE